MRIAVLSDIHANYHALTAVLDDIDHRGVDAIWCLGDIIGRGAFPLETARVLRRRYNQLSADHQRAWLCGNHEMLFFGRIPLGFVAPPVQGNGKMTTISGDNQYAVEMILKHQQIVENSATSETLVEWLESLPPYQEPLFEHVFLAHGMYALNDSGEVDESITYRTYLLEDASINDMLHSLVQHRQVTHGLVMCGHTHISRLVLWDAEAEQAQSVAQHLDSTHTIDLTKQLAYINVGSVGFPRQFRDFDDQCPTYVLLETDEKFQQLFVEFVRVSYDGKSVQLPMDYPEVYRVEMGRC